jgi:hypothetical protein
MGFVLHDQSATELELILNNDTRWNSTYLMIDRALTKQSELKTFMYDVHDELDGERQVPQADILSLDEWLILAEVRTILKPFYNHTMRTQGHGASDASHGRLWEVIMAFEHLLDHVEEWKAFYDDVTEESVRLAEEQQYQAVATATASRAGRPVRDRRRPARLRDDLSDPPTQPQFSYNVNSLPYHVLNDYTRFEPPSGSIGTQLGSDHRPFLRMSLTNMWKKLNEYYIKLGESPLFASAVILHPSYGLRWLKGRWNSGDQLVWLREAEDGLMRFYDQWYSESTPVSNRLPLTGHGKLQVGAQATHF